MNSAIWIILLDTFIAMLAGTAIFTIVFAMGADPSSGAGLIFVVLPTIFPQIGGGIIWGTLFFFILFKEINLILWAGNNLIMWLQIGAL